MLGDHLLLIGGRRGSHHSDVEMINFGTKDDVCQSRDLDSPVEDHSSVATRRGVVTCGGQWNGIRLNKCIVQTKDGKTKPFPSMNRRRSSFGMVLMDQSLIVVGGFGADDTMEKISLNGSRWIKVNLSFRIFNHCVVAINETMVMAIGGYDGNLKVSKRYFDFVTKTRNLRKRRKSF